MDPKIQAWLNTGMLGLIVVGLVYVGMSVEAVERRIDAVEQARVAAPAAAPERVRSVPRVRGATRIASAEGTAVDEALGERLRSGEGREAIDDVMAEREDRERQRMQDRWQRTMTSMADRAVDGVSEELQLDEAVSGELRELLGVYMESRTERWRALRSEEGVDPAKLQEEGEIAREAFEQEVESLVGVEGLELLQDALSRGRGF